MCSSCFIESSVLTFFFLTMFSVQSALPVREQRIIKTPFLTTYSPIDTHFGVDMVHFGGRKKQDEMAKP